MKEYQFFYHSPVGVLELHSTDDCLIQLSFCDKEGEASAQLPQVIKLAVLQLDEYFTGNRHDFTIPICALGTTFQKKVWNALLTIPYGETISYKQLAERVGSKNAWRAVGTANGKNPLAILIPCHRVIASDGSLGGYAGGLHIKKVLLGIEEDV